MTRFRPPPVAIHRVNHFVLHHLLMNVFDLRDRDINHSESAVEACDEAASLRRVFAPRSRIYFSFFLYFRKKNIWQLLTVRATPCYNIPASIARLLDWEVSPWTTWCLP